MTISKAYICDHSETLRPTGNLMARGCLDDERTDKVDFEDGPKKLSNLVLQQQCCSVASLVGDQVSS